MKKPSLDQIYIIIKIIFLVFLILFFGVLTYNVVRITNSVEKSLETMNSTIIQMNENVTKLTDSVILLGDNIRKDVFAQTKSIEKNVMIRLDRIEQKTFTQTEELTQLARDTRVLVNTLNEGMEKNLVSSNETIQETQVLIAETNKNLKNFEQYMDCSVNSFCWPNLIQDSLLSLRNVAQDSNKTFLLLNESIPEYNKNMQQITENTKVITENIAKLTKPKWYDRLISTVIGGAAVVASVRR